MKIINLKKEEFSLKALLEKRMTANYGEYEGIVSGIIQKIRENGDDALVEYTNKFDTNDFTKEQLKVTQNEIEEAYKMVDSALIEVMKRAVKRITEFHLKQKQNSWMSTETDGEILGQKITPIPCVGVYVPGGKAVYPSSVLMNILPAKVAGVQRIIMISPPSREFKGGLNPQVLVAADLCGVNEIYKAGGAQAVAALAFGTQTVPKVDKIVGPGNIYVALAKKAVYGHVNIDSIAGPSEILILADSTGNAKFIAADLLSQAEHDELASAVLITTDETLALKVEKEVKIQTEKLSRKAIIEASLDNYGAIIVVNNMEEGIRITNEIAPEHLEICVQEPFGILTQITNAGAIFMGNYSPEPLGDYMAGPNHVLPTNGTARFFSPLNVDDFVKKSSIIYFNEDALKKLQGDIITFATAEQLTAHANSVRVRFEND